MTANVKNRFAPEPDIGSHTYLLTRISQRKSNKRRAVEFVYARVLDELEAVRDPELFVNSGDTGDFFSRRVNRKCGIIHAHLDGEWAWADQGRGFGIAHRGSLAEVVHR